MTEPIDRSIVIRLSAKQAEQTELLEGLESWLQLGLLSDWQVKQLGQQHLSCPLPTPDTITSIDATTHDPASEHLPAPVISETRTEFFADETDFTPPDAATPSTRTSSIQQLPRSVSNLWGRSLQTFMAEISVIWLLFLGVFLVVVSSSVLAASQWQNFPPVGQYGILWVYTLMFFAAGLWAGQRSNLRLTAQMLQITTLLIIPVNFWMMDGLGLWQSSLGIFMAGLAALTLTAITVFLLRPQSDLLSTSFSGSSRSSRLTTLNSIGLSWLHWGWSIAAMPILATYIGAIGTAILLVWQEIIWQQNTQNQTRETENSQSQEQRFPSAATGVIAFSTLLLIGRALLLAGVLPRQLGLALGICGWVWCWLSRPSTFTTRRQSIWTPVGVALLLLGWGVSVFADPPWQAIGVSGLGLWLLVDRLWVTGRSEVLLALFLVGLQAYGLLWRLFPTALRQSVIDFAAQIVGNTALPSALVGLAGLPYLWVMLGLANWLRQSGQRISAPPSLVLHSRSLVRQAETIALILGICLTLISLANPGVRSLNLLFSTCTLVWMLWKRSTVFLALISPPLVYLTHVTGLVTIVSGIDWLIPTLQPVRWAAIFLGMMAIEWGLSVRGNHSDWQNSDWRRSAWYLGLALAGLSYVALQSIAPPVQNNAQTLIWLIVPTLLTGLSCLRQFPPVQLAAWLSTAALCAQLLLLSSLNTWIAALATATLLMLVNTQRLRHWIAATLTIGFMLGLEATLIWRWFAEQITEDTILLFLAVILWQLWLLRAWLLQHRLNRSPGELKQTYATVANGWGIALCGLTLLLLTGLSAVTFATREVSGLQMLGIGLVIGAIGHRIWQQPTNLGFWGLAWAGETAIAILIARSGGNLANLGFANLGLGLICQLVGDGWVWQSFWPLLRQTRQQRQRPYQSSWHLIPLGYAALGLLLVHTTFTAFTGLYTLIAALTGIGVGRRHARFQPLTLLAVLLGSLSAYELLLYQLLQAEGDYPGDGLTLLAGLSILIAWGDRLLSRWLLPYLQITNRQLQFIAHLHWLFGSGLALLAVLDSLSSIGTVLLILTAIALSGYALAMGNRRWNGDAEPAEPAEPAENSNALSSQAESFQDAWTYAGIAELIATLSYGLYEAIPNTAWLMAWAGAIASVLAVGLYTPPWNRWGWSARPWRDAAVGFPAIVILLTVATVALQSLLITAAFYAWFAKTTRQIRLSYLSVLLFDWALLRFGQQQGWLNLLWVSTILGGSLLYVAQIDPGLQTQSAREQRHWLRSLSTSLVCLTALYQAEVEIGGTAIGVGLLTLVLSMGLIFAGLALRIRAFLYVGTATFILRILRWLWLFINTYSLLLWAVGIVLGLIFIWVAATFEARRSQVNAIVDYWSNQLERWE